MSSLSTKDVQLPCPEGLPSLVGLFHFRWAIPILDLVQQNAAFGRTAVLAKKLDVGRSTVRRTLAALTELQLIQVNAGHGHPLRPEFLLTDSGRQYAPWCSKFAAAIRRRPQIERLAYQKWSMASLFVIQLGARRFTNIQGALPSITPRALTQSLKALSTGKLIERRTTGDFPPRVEYRLSSSGRSLAKVLTTFFDSETQAGS